MSSQPPLSAAERMRRSRARRRGDPDAPPPLKPGPRPRAGGPVTTAVLGGNADLISAVSALYVPDGAVVADVTYSTGRFWRKTDTSRFRLLGSDLYPQAAGTVAADFRALPYRDHSLDVLVLDPPYIHAPGRGVLATRYNGRQTDALASVASIEALYRDGMAEAARVLRPGGQCWVKTKDTVATERQRWHHITVHGYALDLGWYPRDLFLLIPPSPANVSSGRWARQLHARKVHSYLWVLETGGYRRRG